MTAHYRSECLTGEISGRYQPWLFPDADNDPCQTGARFSLYDEDGTHLIDFETEDRS
jgi:hypothetical protein